MTPETQKAEELLQCPFCGYAGYYKEDPENKDWTHWVICDACDAKIGHNKKEKVIRDWNRRAPSTAALIEAAKESEKYLSYLGDKHLFEDAGFSVIEKLRAALAAIEGKG